MGSIWSTNSEESCNDQQPSRHVTTESQRSEDFLEERIPFDHNMTALDRLMSTWKPEERSDSEKKSSLKFPEWRNSKETSKGTTEEQKCYDPRDTTLTFVDGNDDLDFLCENFKGPRAKMSCGHAVTPMSLTNWCRRLLKEGKSRFECGCCDVKWPFEEVCKMALLTPEEIDYFEKKMFSNAARDNLDFKTCPGCQSKGVRIDLDNLCVQCPVCEANKGRTYMFCWQCLREWKGPYPRSDQCENDGCSTQLEILRTCSDITFENVKGVTGCPSIRACPTCGFLLEHNKTKCKNIICPQCKVEFCFVCLRLTVECKSYFIACSTGVAKRQTSIPVWKRK